MIIDGQVYYDPGHHPAWCTCDACEKEHPGKRDFFAAVEVIEDEGEGS